MTKPVLYNYFRSSTSVRVRVALNLKAVDYDYRPVHLVKAEQHSESYRALNPEGLVPALVTATGTVLTQSMAIIEYLEEQHPEPALLPADAESRARVRALAQIVGCDIHPLNNLRVLNKLRDDFAAEAEDITAWFRHWAREGFRSLELRLNEPGTGIFCHGDQPGLADICLYAQTLNNTRFDVDMSPYPIIRRIFAACEALPAFANAAPANQADAN